MEVAESKRESNGFHKEKSKGGIKTMPFIFATEISEKLAMLGFSANMITYLTQQLHIPLEEAANTLTNFSGAASLTPLLGAFLADAFLGRFWTIAAASFIYLIGMASLTVSAVVPQCRPPPCTGTQQCEQPTAPQLSIFYLSLCLVVVGAGGIRPCVVAFGAEQLDDDSNSNSSGGRRQKKTKTWTFFNWYYFCMVVAMLLAVTVVVYVQDNVGWGLGLGIPTVAMVVSVVSFVAGYNMYRTMEPAGSPFTRLMQVVVAAVKKRKVAVAAGGDGLYENQELDANISVFGKLTHTDQLKFFDKAAVIDLEDVETKIRSTTTTTPQQRLPPTKPNLWRLSTVHRVEELKSLIRMGPIWAAGILVATASAQQQTFSVQQAQTMDRRLSSASSFEIPPGSMTVFTLLAVLTTITIYDCYLIPVARRLTGLPRGISFLHRMGVGFAICILATSAAALIEVKRRHTATAHGLTDSPHATIPISIFWLVPQYTLLGIAEAFASIGLLEFFYDQSPESMRSTAMALIWLSTAAGNYVSTLVVSVIHHVSAGPGGSNWLPDNLNKGRLEYFYWIITLLQVANLVYYCVCAWFYTYKPVEVTMV